VTRAADGESVRWEGRLVPFAPLTRSLEVEACRGEARSWSAVVVEGAGVLAAVGVDRLVGTESVILRTLPNEVHARPVIGGASLDARGLPQPFLDPAVLVANVRAARLSAPVAAPARRVVLVVDDSLTTRMLEKSILESAGYEVDLATSGEEGLAKAKRRPYALFLVDVEMPGMDGFEFVARTRADSLLGSVPAILVSSRQAPEDRLRGEQAGARAYIVKGDFDQGYFLRTIRQLIG
jgi:two-component system chemotaxis sensor kinase CheA